ncbi:MAG: outer membrane beta-barrel domain-containing protein [Bdellovibrionota bacterium]
MGQGYGKRFLFVASLFLCAFELSAQDAALSPVEAYQIESQYGPEVAVLNPIFDKNNSFEFMLGASYSPMSSLYDYAGVSGGVAYHLNRRHSLEAFAQYNFFAELSTFAEGEIKDKCIAVSCAGSGLGIDIPIMMVGALYTFTPYYTKMHLTDMSVVHMDITASIGPSGVLTEEAKFNNTTGDRNWQFGGMLAAGIRILKRNRWGFRVELKDFIHSATNVGAKEIVNDLQLSAGVSIFLSSFPSYTD